MGLETLWCNVTGENLYTIYMSENIKIAHIYFHDMLISEVYIVFRQRNEKQACT